MEGSIIEVLFQHYITSGETDSEEVTAILHEIHTQFESFQKSGIINANDRETLYDSVLQACGMHTKAGFVAGMQMTYQFANELRKD